MSHVKEAHTSMQLIVPTIRCCVFLRFFLCRHTEDIIIDDPTREKNAGIFCSTDNNVCASAGRAMAFNAMVELNHC